MFKGGGKWSSNGCDGKKTSGGFIDVNGGVSKGGSLIVTHHDYSSNGYQGGNGTGGTGGGSGGINTHGGSYAYGYDYAPGKHAYNISFKSIMDRTSSPAHGYLVPDKTINLRNNSLTDSEIAVLAGNLQYQRLDLDVFDVSNNKIGFGGVENLFYGLRFDNTLAGRYIVTMNFSNNLIGDDGAKYMADSLAMGRFPNLKSLDVSGNQITSTGEGYFVNSLESLKKQDIAIILKKITETGNEAIKAAVDFTLKALKYSVQQFAKEQWELDKIKIDGCGGMGVNIGKGFIAGLIKCAPLEAPQAIFLCSLKEGAIQGLFEKETLQCIGDINDTLEKSDCSIF